MDAGRDLGLVVLIFAATAAMLAAREGRMDPVGLDILLFMGTYAAFRSRAIPYFVLAAAPLLALALVRLAADARARADGGWPRRWERLGALACLQVLATSIGATVASGVPFRLGFGPLPNSYPEGAAAFLQRHRLDGRLFNTYQFGGYLLWRRWPAARSARPRRPSSSGRLVHTASWERGPDVSESLTQVLRWVYWWNSTEELPDDVSDSQALMQLNTDFSRKGLASQDVQAIVAAWQAGAISQDTMHELFRRGEVLPEGRTNEEEAELIEQQRREDAKTSVAAGASGTPVDGR